MAKVSRQFLEYQADRIEMTLYSVGIQARITGGLVAPRFVRFNLSLPWGKRWGQVRRLEPDLAHRLGVSHVRVALVGGQLSVEVPRQESQIVPLYELCKRMGNIPSRTCVLGISNEEDGIPLLLRLPSPDVGHVLVAGTTGSGKTALARTMALSLAMHNRQAEIQLAIIDPKGRGYNDLADVPHLMRPIAVEPEDSAHFLRALVEEMLERDRQRVSEPRIVLVIDELADLIEAGGGEVLTSTTRLLQRGREAGIHVIGCTQKPTADCIGGLVKSNFPARLVGSVVSPEDAKVASGMKGTGAEHLTGMGDFLLVVKGRVVHFQAAYSNVRTTQAIVARMATGHRQSRRWLTEYPLMDTPALPGRDDVIPVACPPDLRRRLNRWVPRVVVDNRPEVVERDALTALRTPGWAEAWITNGQFRYGYQTEIGRLIGKSNAGADRRHILAVAAKILELCAGSTSTSTGEEGTNRATEADSRAVGS